MSVSTLAGHHSNLTISRIFWGQGSLRARVAEIEKTIKNLR